MKEISPQKYGREYHYAEYRQLVSFIIVSLLSVCLNISQPLPAVAANGSVTYTYDALGRLATASYDTGIFVIYSYDANGNRTQQVINVNSGTTLIWTSTVSPCTSNCWGAAVW